MFIFLYVAFLSTALFLVARVLWPELKKSSSFASDQSNKPDERTEKLETLLEEKNKNNQFIQKELRIFQAQTRDFNKVKDLLDEEIHRLREQNRVLRSELGLPSVQSGENSRIAAYQDNVSDQEQGNGHILESF